MGKRLVTTYNITFYSRDGVELFGYEDIKRVDHIRKRVSFEVWGDGKKTGYIFKGLAFRIEEFEEWQ